AVLVPSRWKVAEPASIRVRPLNDHCSTTRLLPRSPVNSITHLSRNLVSFALLLVVSGDTSRFCTSCKTPTSSCGIFGADVKAVSAILVQHDKIKAFNFI